MGLRCSLLGHSFGEATVQREREERGNEVVTVVREIEACKRCGRERVVSENKEVTSVVEPEEVGLDEGEVQGAGSFNEDEFEPPDSPEEEDAEIIEETPGDREPGEWPEEPGGRADPVAEGAAPDPESADEDAEVDPAQASLDDTMAADRDVEDAGPAPEASPGMDRDTGESLTVPEGTLACPECGLEVDADSSFRAGDACPECQRGYLEQVE